jgi:OmcA/MtrC family decaheme c-type cytochrome
VGKIVDLVPEHGKFLPANQGTVTATINSITFGAPAGDNVPVSVNFTLTAINSAGVNINSTTDLRTLTTTAPIQLAWVRLSLAKLTAGTNGGADAWGGYIVTPGTSGTNPFASRNGTLTLNGALSGGNYTYIFPDNAVRVSDGYVDNAVHRVALYIGGFPAGSFNPDPNIARPVGNITNDMVNPIGGGTVTAFIDPPAAYPAGYPRKDVVTTAACNECHDPLALHGGGRRETKLCVTCHNAKLQTVAGTDSPNGWQNSNFVNLVHKIHTAQNLGPILDASEVTYPILIEPVTNAKLGIRDVRNCTKCHKGLDAYWNTRPTREACGSCHVNVNFATGQGHSAANFPQADDSGCAVSFCHGSATLQPSFVHRTENLTPNNLTLPSGLDVFEYNITSVTVDTDNVTPVVKFWIKRNGAFQDLLNPADNTLRRPTGYSTASQPSFLVAWALPQDGVTTPADYNNLKSPAAPASTTGNGAGQPPSVNITGLPATGTSAEYTVKLTGAKFPAGAKMRAVALQGYFTQIVGTDNVGRHTPSVVKGVTGDAVRRTVVKSGYDNTTGTLKPVGCLECHEIFEGHGGSRVNNVQVCVICHNPNLSSSGRTLVPGSIDNAVVAVLGPDPLTYPEATNNMKSLIHGIHAAPVRETPFQFVRNRSNGFFYDWSEVTYPGNLRNCQKCHNGVTYDADLPAGQLLSTEKITTGNAAETRAQIIAARGNTSAVSPATGTMNLTDLVNSPTVGACVYCHDSSASQSHFVLNGGDILSTRAEALLSPTNAP